MRKYSCHFSLKRQTSVFNSFTKPVLAKSAEYLNLRIENLKKPDIIHALIVKIQNLLPDTCQICKESYVSRIDDSPFLACELCGQEVHKQCFLNKLGLTGTECLAITSLINPHQLPGIHYFCGECEKEVVPDDSPSIGPKVVTNPVDDKQPALTQESSCNDQTLCHSDNCVEQPVSDGKVVPTEEDDSSSKLPVPKRSNNAPGDSPSNKPKTKLCVHYKRNQCRHGLKGKECAFSHPERCKKLLQFGTKSGGCNLGKKMPLFSPKDVPFFHK